MRSDTKYDLQQTVLSDTKKDHSIFSIIKSKKNAEICRQDMKGTGKINE